MRLAITTVLVILFLALGMYFFSGKTRQPFDATKTRQHIEELEKRVTLLAATLGKSSSSTPMAGKEITKAGSPVGEILAALPGVTISKRKNGQATPAQWLVHVVVTTPEDKSSFEKRMAGQFASPLLPQDLDTLYQEHLLIVEARQLEEMATLKILVEKHGLATVLVAGQQEEIPDLALLKERETEVIAQFREQLAEIRELANGLAGEELAKANQTENSLRLELEKHDQHMRLLGPVVRLVARGVPIKPVFLTAGSSPWERDSSPVLFLADSNPEATQAMVSTLPARYGYVRLGVFEP